MATPASGSMGSPISGLPCRKCGKHAVTVSETAPGTVTIRCEHCGRTRSMVRSINTKTGKLRLDSATEGGSM